MNTENSYCRLCAELKCRSKLTDLETDLVAHSDILNKLIRLNCELDFKGNNLPRTVCFLCTNALESAFRFVLAIDRAQIELNQAITSQSLNPEVEASDTSDSERITYELLEYNDNIDLKTEVKAEDTILRNIEINSESEQDSDTTDTIIPSELKLSWKEYSWLCSYCEMQFPSLSELRAHSMQHHNACNAYRCIDCNRRRLGFKRFLKHVRTHRKHLLLSCYYCYLVSPSLYEAVKHRSEHITSKFICTGCNLCFPNNEELNAHISTFFKNIWAQNKPLQLEQHNLICPICKKESKTKQSLKTHLLTHTDRQREHICYVCGKCFFTKPSLEAHFIVHDDKRPFQCDICKSFFKTKIQLRSHIGTHENKKPLSCEKCGRCFRLQRHLKSHSVVHVDSLPYVCTFCKKGFRFKTRLDLHMRQHTGVRPYTCDICPKDFTNWPNYNKHMKRRHNMNMSKRRINPEGLPPVDTPTSNLLGRKKLKKKENQKDTKGFTTKSKKELEYFNM